jgi:hypothetical protein
MYFAEDSAVLVAFVPAEYAETRRTTAADTMKYLRNTLIPQSSSNLDKKHYI